ncbi:UNVERIFIED_CONTAM: hypothetical protein K2H54_029079 [Gekko kuhli]
MDAAVARDPGVFDCSSHSSARQTRTRSLPTAPKAGPKRVDSGVKPSERTPGSTAKTDCPELRRDNLSGFVPGVSYGPGFLEFIRNPAHFLRKKEKSPISS